MTSNLHNNVVTIHYNDKSVKMETNRPLNIKWINGKNGKASEPTKPKYINPDLPVVNFSCVEPLSSRPAKAQPFKMPTSYLHCATEEEEYDRNEIEYDLDREDLLWLKLANSLRRKLGQPLIDESILESAIDMLEKESHFQFALTAQNNVGFGYFPLIDNDAPCCICNDGEDSNANQIIFCDMCNIAVHQECYGVPYIPEGQWLCRRCQMSPSVPVVCALCPYSAGAFKQTSDGRWAHVVCAIWLNEVHFANTVFLEPVEGIDFSIKRRHKLTCLVCKKKMGACLQCSNKSCVRSFHATCGINAGMRMEVQENRSRKNPDAITIDRFAYCYKHSKFNDSSNKSANSWKREMDQKLREARKMLEISAKHTPKSVPVPVIPHEKVKDIARHLELIHINDICAYWSLKRKSRSGVPLIRRLQVYLNQQKPISGRPLDGTTEKIANSTGIEASAAKESADPLTRYAYMRRNCERVRLLCELVKKREKMKREMLLNNEAIVTKSLKPLSVVLHQTLEKLIEKDHQKIFTKPVTEDEVPGYSAIISHPMDFQKMRHRFIKYKKLADLRSDFMLMMQNCATFNKDNQYFFNYGQRQRRIGLSVIRAAEIEEMRLNEVSVMMEQAVDLSTLDSDVLLKISKELKLFDSQREEKSIELAISTIANKKKTTKEKQGLDDQTQLESMFQQQRKRKSNRKTEQGNSSQIAYQLNNGHLKMTKPSSMNSTAAGGEKPKKQGRKSDNNKVERRKSQRDGANAREKAAIDNVKAAIDKVTARQKEAKGITEKRRDKETKSSTQSDRRIPIQTRSSYGSSDGIDLRGKNTLYTSQHEASTSSHGRVVNKQCYLNACLTEASSVESDDGNFDMFASVTEDNDFPPPLTMRHEQNNMQRGGSKNAIIESDEFAPPSPDSFSHNDLVMAPLDNAGLLTPARVIDLRMHAIDFDDEKEDIINGMGKHFIDHALLEMPRETEKGRQSITLIMFFDKNNTWKWMANDKMQLLYPSELENNFKNFGKNKVLADAFKKAQDFWNNVINTEDL